MATWKKIILFHFCAILAPSPIHQCSQSSGLGSRGRTKTTGKMAKGAGPFIAGIINLHNHRLAIPWVYVTV